MDLKRAIAPVWFPVSTRFLIPMRKSFATRAALPQDGERQPESDRVLFAPPSEARVHEDAEDRQQVWCEYALEGTELTSPALFG